MLVDSEDSRYLATLLDYVHLNPIRAGIIRLAEGHRLLDYPWSSLPGYIRTRERPSWLQVERGLAAMNLEDIPASRRRLIEDLERRAAEDQAEHAGMSIVDEQNLQSTLRRGWYYGRATFRDWLLDKADELLRRRGSKRKNYHGREVREHGEAAARRLIAQGLASERLIPAELSRDDSVGRVLRCAADLAGVQGVRRAHIEAKYVSAEQRSTSAKDQADEARIQLHCSGSVHYGKQKGRTDIRPASSRTVG